MPDDVDPMKVAGFLLDQEPGSKEPESKEPKPKEPEPKEPDVKGSGPKAAQWKELKDDRDKYKQRVAELEKRYEAEKLELLAKTSNKTSGMEKELEELRLQLRGVSAQNDPEIKRKYDAPLKAAIKSAQVALGSKAGAVDRLLQLEGEAQGEALDSLLEDLSPAKQTRVLTALAEIERLQTARNSEVEQLSQNWENTQEQRQAEARKESQVVFEEQEKEWMDAFGDAVTDETRALARYIFEGDLNPRERARSAMWSASASGMVSAMTELKKENEQLRQKLGLSSGNVEPGGSLERGEDEVPEGVSLGDLVVQKAEEAGLLAR